MITKPVHNVLTVLLLASIGCRAPQERTADSLQADSVRRATQDSINRTTPEYVVDSILPVEEELRRFRGKIGGDSAARLVGGAGSREALVRQFVSALSSSDTLTLERLLVSPREFADLYYPESPYTRPPYRQPPALAWTLMNNPSRSGLTRLLRRMGGTRISYVSHRCEPKVVREGKSSRFTGCLVQLVEPTGDLVTRRLFGSILERDGQFKFMSYSNQF